MNTKKSFALAVAAATTLGLALPACAQPVAGPVATPGADAAGQAAPAAPGGYGVHGDGHGYGRPMTLADYQARSRERVMRADTDHDGRVSLAEWNAYQADRSGGADHGGGRWRGGGFGGDPAGQFQMMDANHDGYVTPAEVDAMSAERFARMDANHDGVVTPDERRALRGGGGEGQPPPQ